MTEAMLFMLGLGLACGSILSIASKIFYVYEDPRIAEVESKLAGANCGGCGYAGCSAAAVAVVEGSIGPSVCVISGSEVASSVAAVMGIDPGSAEPRLSYNTCKGGLRATVLYEYMGVNSCQALAAFFGGNKECEVGCLGLGDCVKSCSFGALKLGHEGYPIVDETKCVGCGACEKQCPKNIMQIKSMSEKLLHLNQLDDRLAPCRQTCPAEIDIPQYILQIKNQDYTGAVNTIRQRNPLLLSCGRVCPHPCENDCRRALVDDAVSINQLKRFVADYEMNSGIRYPISCAPLTGKKVAVIGGGPAGLSCAYFLRRLGHSVTIFDSMPKLGGMIRYGIPEYRLPKKVLEWEIENILNLGVEQRLNVKFGSDFNMTSLTAAGYEAIFLGVGAWKDYMLNIEGENLKGCYTGINFLTGFAQNQQGDSDLPIPVGKKCAVIGGGNTAIDCVRTLIRLGADEVSIVYRRTRKEMPANLVEIEAAEHEGVKFNFLAAPSRVIGDKNGNVTQLEYLKMELGEPDASGRRRPVPIEGSETLINVDMLITAIGQGPEISFIEKEKRIGDLKTTRWNTIDSDDPITLQTTIPYVFTGGDSATGASLVVEAIGGGRRAARSIHMFLSGQTILAPPKTLFQKHIPKSFFTSIDGSNIKKSEKTKMPELPVDKRIKSFIEADLVISEKDALYESNRCLNCCVTCFNKK